MDEKRLEKWRLILGQQADPEGTVGLEGDAKGMDEVLEALYDSDRKGSLGSSSPKVNRWLGDIRKYFPSSVVQIMQKDALERLNMERMLLEPELLETIEVDAELVGIIISLSRVMNQKTKDSARKVVQKVVQQLEKKLRNPLRQAIEGSLNKAVRNRRPKFHEINWHRTIQANLKHYQPSLNTIIPEHLIGYGKKGQSLKKVILMIDQSGSMATSVVYASVFGAIMASLRSIKTHLIAFDTAVLDLTADLEDPVDLLFGTQLGGGTDINKALTYAQTLIVNPKDTILVLISDLFEGGRISEMLRRTQQIKGSGVQFIALLALNDKGAPMYDRNLAAAYAQMDIPAFACTPDLFPDLMAAAIKKESISSWMARMGID